MGNTTPHLQARVCAVMQEVEAVERSRDNKFHGYKYASVDDIYSALRKVMAKHGLSFLLQVIKIDLQDAGIGKDGKLVKWLRMDAALALVAADGEREDWSYRHLFAPYTGPQSMEAAVSYIAKQYLRQRFMISTGDRDMDQTGDIPHLPDGQAHGSAWLRKGAVEVFVGKSGKPELKWRDALPDGWQDEENPDHKYILQAAFSAIRKWLYTLPEGDRDHVHGGPLYAYVKLMPETGQSALLAIITEGVEEEAPDTEDTTETADEAGENDDE